MEITKFEDNYLLTGVVVVEETGLQFFKHWFLVRFCFQSSFLKKNASMGSHKKLTSFSRILKFFKLLNFNKRNLNQNLSDDSLFYILFSILKDLHDLKNFFYKFTTE